MAFRYPSNYSFAILRPANSSRRSLDADLDNFSRLYVNSRLRPLTWDLEDEAGASAPRTGARESSLQSPAPESSSSVSRTDTRRRQDRSLRVPAVRSRSPGSVDEHGRRSAITEIVRERGDVIPFSLAIKELHHQLGLAVAFYINFDSEYGKDIAQIKKYATGEILENLWARKVRRSKDPGTAAQDRYHNRDGDNLIAEYEDRFAIWKRKLSHALSGAITSGLGESSHDDRNSTRHQSKIRLVDKIRMANRQLRPLLDTAWKRRELCRDLITELKMLKGLVDPGKGNREALPTNNGAFDAGTDDRIRMEMNVEDEQEQNHFSERAW